MASKVQQSQRFINFINQQLKKLKRERETVIETVDDAISQVQNEVDAWINGGLVNQTTCVEINNRIQHVITLFMTKTMELSDVEIKESESVLSSATRNNSKIPKTSYPREELQETAILSIEKTVNASGVDTSYITTMKFDILEEAVFSLKKSTEQMQEKQKVLNKKLERLTNAKFKSEKKIKKRITVLEKTNQEMSSNVETLRNIEVKLNKIEEENKSVKVTINELNEQISSVRTCSNDALMSLQDLSKSVESTNQHYNEMSNKINQLEISINLMSSQYTEQLENMERLNKDKIDSLIGVVCQLVAERLKPIENLKEALNKISTTKTPLSLKVDGIESQLVDLSNKIVQIESKCCLPNVGFYAWGNFDLDVGEYNLENFSVESSYGDHFDSVSGKFITPFNGFYLMSISAKLDEDNSINITCDEKKICQTDKSRSLGMCLGRETITIFAELKKGEQVYLKLFIKKEDMDTDINFSCCRING